MIGIYKITCATTGKIYVGSSIDIHRRFREHRSRLKTQKHSSIYLQRAWNKYGKDNFLLSILEECKDSELIEKEQYWIDKLKPYLKEIGFNMVQEACAGNYRFKIYIITFPDGREERVENLSKFCRDNNLSISSLRACCAGMMREHRGYRCRKYGEDVVQYKRTPVSKMKNWKDNESFNDRFWLVIKPDHTEVKLKNLGAFCRENGLHSGHMAKVANGKLSHHKGFRCYRQGRIVKFQEKLSLHLWKIYYKDGTVEVVENLKNFAKDHQLCYSSLFATSTGRRNHTKGFRCEKIINPLAKTNPPVTINDEENNN